jgi:hypothetical protein
MITIETSRVDYGGFVVHNWTLVQTTKGQTRSWYLGQDGKFCKRILGLEPREVVQAIGDNDLGNPKTRRRLAKFIMAELNLSSRELRNLQPWQLAAE